MVSTQKILTLAIFLQLILGSVVLFAIQPDNSPGNTQFALDSYGDSVLSDIRDGEQLKTRTTGEFIQSGETGLNALKVSGTLIDIFLAGYIVPFTYTADSTTFEQFIVWFVGVYSWVVTLYFILEVIMLIWGKKTT